jgi:hypothetical protein
MAMGFKVQELVLICNHGFQKFAQKPKPRTQISPPNQFQKNYMTQE